MSSTAQLSRAGTFAKKRSEEALRQANVQTGDAIQPKKPPGIFGQPIVALKTNLHRLDVDTLKLVKICRYEVKIAGVRRNGNEIILTAPSPSSDYRTYERRYICLGVYKAFLQFMTPTNTENVFYYDLQRLFFSLNDMNLNPKSKDFLFTPAQIGGLIPFEELTNDFDQYRMNITQFPDENFQITLGDFSSLEDLDLDKTDTSVEQFLNIATSQNIFVKPAEFVNYSASACYFLQPSNYGFEMEDCPEFKSNSSFLGIGVHKNVRPILAPNGSITYAMIVQVKKSPFHINIDKTIIDKVLRVLRDSGEINKTAKEMKAKVEEKVKGIWVITTHRPEGKNQKFEVSGLSEESSMTQKIRIGNEEITIQRYFQRRYGKTLQYPHLPLAIRKVQNDSSYYPMEVCKIFDNQRVMMNQEDPAAISQMIRHTAIPPAKLMQQNNQVRPSLGLDGVNPSIDAAGITFNPTPMEVKGRLLPHPEIEFARNEKEKPRTPEATWKGFDQYLVPAKLEKWMAIAIAVDGEKGITQDAFRNFVENFRERMTHMGMQNPPPSEIRYRNSEELNFEDFFKELEGDCFEFVLFAHPDNEDSIHRMFYFISNFILQDSMKYYEQRTEVITQGIKNSTITKFGERHQPHTMANIVHKTNIKMGGLNYVITQSLLPTPELSTFFGNEVLYIGFAGNFPGAGFRVKSDDDLALFPPTQNGNGAQNGPNNHNGNGSKSKDGNSNGNNGPQPQTSTSKETTNGNKNGNNGAQIKPNPPSIIGFSANIGRRNWFEFVGDYVYQEPVREARIDLIAGIVQRCVNQFHLREKAFPKSIIIFHNGLNEGSFKGILTYQVPLIKQGLRDINCNAKISLFVVNKRQPIRLFPQRVDPRLKSPEQNIHPGTVVDTEIVRPNFTEFYLNSHRPIQQGTAQVPRYNVLFDENNLSMDMIQMICHVLCFGHQIVYSPTSLPTPVFLAEEYAKRGRNNFNTWSSIGSATFAGIRTQQQLTNYLSMTNTQYLRYMRPNA